MILTPDQLRQFVDFATGSDADRALQQLLDATEADIEQVAGSPQGDVVELVTGGYETLLLSRPIGAIVSIVDDSYSSAVTLAADDYRHLPGGFVLRRLWTGTNPRNSWSQWVTVTYTPVDDMAQRIAVQVGLIKLAIAYHPGLLSQTIGDWSETYQASGADAGFEAEREALLCTLGVAPTMVVL